MTVPAHAEYLNQIAADLLTAAREGVDPTRTDRPAPTRAFVSLGPPAVPLCTAGDAGQLTVHLDHLDYKGLLPIKQTPGSHQVAPVGDYRVQLWRCIPTVSTAGESPSPEETGRAALNLQIDGWCLATAITRALYAKTLVTTVMVGDIQVQRAGSLPPQGLVAGWEIGLLVALNDPGPT